MKLSNAIKKLEKAEFTVTRDAHTRSGYNAVKGEDRISFFDQNGEVICVGVGLVDSDAHYDTYFDNISQAVRCVDRVCV